MSLVNLLRMAGLLITGDIYSLRQTLRNRSGQTDDTDRPSPLPKVSIIVPAFNEQAGISRTLRSLERLDYPYAKLEVVVVNDGSSDATLQRIRSFAGSRPVRQVHSYVSRDTRDLRLRRRYLRLPIQAMPLTIVDQANQGKATALNNGIRKHSSGELVMCLDADSLLDRQALRRAARHFEDPSVVALASNVNIIEDGTVLGLTQRIEYLIAHQIKKAQTMLNVDYIIGGIGSMFRRDILRTVNYYDTNTMTEDIDLSMKIVSLGNRQHRLVYAADMITYTEAVPSYKSLIRQRYRWKYGRLQTFLKNTRLFFNADSRYARLLTLFMLPNTLFQEIIFLFEPFFVGFIIYTAVRYHSVAAIFSAVCIIGVYATVNIWGSEHLSVRERIRLTLYAPAVYFLINIISLVDYVALAKSVANITKLRASIKSSHVTWKSPERSGLPVRG